MFISITRFSGEDINSLDNGCKFVINTKYIRYIEKINDSYSVVNLDTGAPDGIKIYVTSEDTQKIMDSMNANTFFTFFQGDWGTPQLIGWIYV